MTKTVGTTGNAQRTGVGVSPVRVQGFPKITSEPRAEEEFLLYYKEEESRLRRYSLRYRERI
ncbi:MAG: hypothetical protein PUD21_00595 [Clostridiaceae bacterium]|nr:hypothetical protein [Clostridiaceae bacterium]